MRACFCVKQGCFAPQYLNHLYCVEHYEKLKKELENTPKITLLKGKDQYESIN